MKSCKKIIFCFIFLTNSLLASEVNILTQVSYNGEDRLGDLCTMTLIEVKNNTYTISVNGPIHSNFSGASRIFQARVSMDSVLSATGSVQTYLGEKPIVHSDEKLTLKLSADGAPDSFQIANKKNSFTCNDLYNGPM